MNNNWKNIWNKREDHFRDIDMTNKEQVFMELKRIDGFDINAEGEGLTYQALIYQHEDIRQNLSFGGRTITSLFDVGCGCGANLYLFHEEGITIGGIDYSEKMIEIAKKLFHNDELKECICGEAIHVPTQIQYDAILANSVFSYFSDLEYTEAVLEKLLQKTRYSIGLIDLHNADKKQEFIEYRKRVMEDYEERYRNLPKLFYEKQFFIDFAKKHNCEVRFTESVLDGYWNNPYIFNCFLYKK